MDRRLSSINRIGDGLEGEVFTIDIIWSAYNIYIPVQVRARRREWEEPTM